MRRVTVDDCVFANTRYNRQLNLPLIGHAGQEKISNSSAVIVGAGGVKSPLLMYLAAAGVGRLRIIDFDRVELSNLNRQILFTVEDVGKNKASVAVDRLSKLNPEIQIEAVEARVSESNIDDLLSGFDLVFEGGDGFANRRSFNQWALRNHISFIHASAHYNYSVVTTVMPGLTHCLECIYEQIDGRDGGPVPIVGVAAGIAGVVAASEALNIIVRSRAALADKLWFYQGWTAHTEIIDLSNSPPCVHFPQEPRRDCPP